MSQTLKEKASGIETKSTVLFSKYCDRADFERIGAKKHYEDYIDKFDKRTFVCPDATSFITLLANNATHERSDTKILVEGLVGNNRRAIVEDLMSKHLIGLNVVHE